MSTTDDLQETKKIIRKKEDARIEIISDFAPIKLTNLEALFARNKETYSNYQKKHHPVHMYRGGKIAFYQKKICVDVFCLRDEPFFVSPSKDVLMHHNYLRSYVETHTNELSEKNKRRLLRLGSLFFEFPYIWTADLRLINVKYAFLINEEQGIYEKFPVKKPINEIVQSCFLVDDETLFGL